MNRRALIQSFRAWRIALFAGAEFCYLPKYAVRLQRQGRLF